MSREKPVAEEHDDRLIREIGGIVQTQSLIASEAIKTIREVIELQRERSRQSYLADIEQTARANVARIHPVGQEQS